MIKKIVFSFLMLSFLISPFITNASTFTNLKSQLFYLSEKIANFDNTSKVNNGEVLGATSTLDNITLKFEVTPEKLPWNEGGDVTLTWSSTGMETWTCEAYSYPEIPEWTGSKELNGNQIINLPPMSFAGYDQYFKLECKGMYWGSMHSQRIDRYVKYENESLNPHFKANPVKVKKGGSTILSWDSNSYATKYCRSDDGLYGPVGSPNYQWFFPTEKKAKGSQVINNINKSTSFSIYCSDYGSHSTDTVYVEVYSLTNDENDDVIKKEEIRTSGEEGNLNYCTFVFDKNFGYWAVDAKDRTDVSRAQSILVDEGFLTSKEVTGKFYLKTKNALIQLQKKYGLFETGRVDTTTRNKLNSLYKEYCNK